MLFLLQQGSSLTPSSGIEAIYFVPTVPLRVKRGGGCVCCLKLSKMATKSESFVVPLPRWGGWREIDALPLMPAFHPGSVVLTTWTHRPPWSSLSPLDLLYPDDPMTIVVVQ